MPYIVPAARKNLEEGNAPSTAGELNYLITLLCMSYLEGDAEPSYGRLNEVVGVLECAKLEFYRRIVADYEEDKMEENGDVY